MLERIKTNIKALVESDREKGLTVAEQVVVIVVIALLGGIILYNLLPVRENAFDAAVQSDIRNAALSAETNYIDNLTYHTGDNEPLEMFSTREEGGPAASDGHAEYGVVIADDGQSFQVWGLSRSGMLYVLDSTDGGLKEADIDNNGELTPEDGLPNDTSVDADMTWGTWRAEQN